uniref:Ig-like domain-containing protein n=1 Tax=Periophthalmus magnuspinnatus TaxID=409849 RepID=A0A3B4A037_9GOBI
MIICPGRKWEGPTFGFVGKRLTTTATSPQQCGNATFISSGQNTLVVPSQPIIAPVGSDVTLPCQLDPVKDLRDMVVEWSRHDLTPRYIHIRRDGLDFLIDQNSLYLGRTSVSESRLQQGDMSLSLTRVRASDGGKYRCYIPQTDTEAEVTLLVGECFEQRSGSPVLRCESRGWYPEPELEWLDSEGTVLLRTEAQRGASEELFSVSSRLSVEQRLGNTFTCRVRQQESGQSREAQLSITGQDRESSAPSAPDGIK